MAIEVLRNGGECPELWLIQRNILASIAVPSLTVDDRLDREHL